MSRELAGRRVLVTGGSRGIGRAVSEELAAQGAHVVVTARDAAAVEACVAALPGDGHVALAFDVSDDAGWHDAIARASTGGLHGLVTAAGVLEPIGATDEVDPAAVLRTLQINLHGTFLALHHVLPHLRAAGGAAVTFSGGGATGPLPRYDAYAMSKAAVVRLTENVAAAEPDVRVNAIAPGFVATGMHQATLTAGAEAAGAAYFERTRKDLEGGGVSPRLAARLACALLSERTAGISGRLLSAQWDPWEDDAFLDRLRADPDLGTLRRVDGVFFTRGPGE
jgi:NAD(P)-dependent dehydrogenase (short-subunit alcohol dehydrogenase family)